MTDASQIARRIFHETLASIDIPRAMERRINRVGQRICVDDWSCDLTRISGVKVVALGKAAHAMLSGFVRLFPDLAITGVDAVPTSSPDPVPGIAYFLGGHVRRIRFGDITDGLSNTLLVGERPPRPDHETGWWALPSLYDNTLFTKVPGRGPDFRRWLRLDGVPPQPRAIPR